MTQYSTQIIITPILIFGTIWEKRNQLRKKNMEPAGKYHDLCITFS